MENKINANGLAIYNFLKDNEGKTFAFAEIANAAGIEAKTGFLTSAKKIAQSNGYAIVKVEDAVEVKIKTVTTFASGLEIASEKTATVAGYTLAKAE